MTKQTKPKVVKEPKAKKVEVPIGDGVFAVSLELVGGQVLKTNASVFDALTSFIPEIPAFIKGYSTLTVSSGTKSISFNITPVVLKRIRVNQTLRLIYEKRAKTVLNG